jgi:hypothetical protein
MSRRYKGALWVSLALIAAGCAQQGRPITGSVLLKKETFTGSMQEPVDGNGSVTMTSNLGARCSGHYSYLMLKGEAYLGNLDLTCDDGRKGGVVLIGDADKPGGIGTLGDDLFTLGQ